MESVVLLFVLGAVLVGRWYLRTPSGRGWVGEATVKRGLAWRLNPEEYHVLNDLTLPTDRGTTQIDHVVLSRFGIFVIETKNWAGWIFGGADQSEWTQVHYKRKRRFQNPLRQNYLHIKAVEKITDVPPDHLHGLVVFVGDAEFKTLMPASVVLGSGGLADAIRLRRKIVFSEAQVLSLQRKLERAALQPGRKTRVAHVAHANERRAQRQQDTISCPRCGAKMRERTNRQSGARFLGCARYPKCKGTRAMPEKEARH
ncbi:NERD domain-containing protein [Shimia sp. CNT1-13L.2]|uniref:nuclease-related domain-containing protein n=1 Tax=Shimia sp. CNT1-13L.2 TaxID=2959663 RepID=UPI0020CC64B3|nr:NERD domain-containing protein [Shimia sp. CNT1-13L.2]MCP9482019.1 NERD domain-containing protein [Shimia sp. CNT1-13L.2]